MNQETVSTPEVRSISRHLYEPVTKTPCDHTNGRIIWKCGDYLQRSDGLIISSFEGEHLVDRTSDLSTAIRWRRLVE
jgi:hypothetical protein